MRTTRPAPGGSLRPGIASAAPLGQCGATFQAGKGPVEPMLHSDFLAHLAERGALRHPQALDAGLRDRRPETRGEFDWVGLTKLTQSGFAEELATFYGCDRVNRGDLVASRFLGTQLSPRFLRERRLFPYETPSGTLTLAVATPADGAPVSCGRWTNSSGSRSSSARPTSMSSRSRPVFRSGCESTVCSSRFRRR